MKWLKVFPTHSDYESYITGSSVAYPNVSVCVDEYEVHMTDIGEIVDPDNPHDYSQDYLTLVVVQSGKIGFMSPMEYHKHEYSLDGGETWNFVPMADGEGKLTVNVGDRIMLKGTPTEFDEYGGSLWLVGDNNGSAKINVEGNAMSLLYGDNFTGQTSLTGKNYALTGLFGCAASAGHPVVQVINARNLILPATTLSTGCYQYMFAGCTELTSAPELPATTLAQSCYMLMFWNCTGLNYIKCLAEDISASNCTSNWVNGVQTNSGTFVKATSMTSWTTGNSGIPTGWTVEDAS